MSYGHTPTKDGHYKILRSTLSNVALATGNRIAQMRKRSRIIMVVGAWLLVVTILLAFGL